MILNLTHKLHVSFIKLHSYNSRSHRQLLSSPPPKGLLLPIAIWDVNKQSFFYWL